MPKPITIAATAAAMLLAAGAATAAAGPSGGTYAVQPTSLGAASDPATAGVYADAGGAYATTADAISRLYDDPDGDFFTLMPRNGRSFRLVVPGHADVSCSGTSVVRGIGGQWFPGTADGATAQTGAHVLCPRPDGSEWRVLYPATGCVTVSRSGAALIGSTWTVSAPGTCSADVQFKAAKGRSFASVARTPVPFVLTGRVASSLADLRGK